MLCFPSMRLQNQWEAWFLRSKDETRNEEQRTVHMIGSREIRSCNLLKSTGTHRQEKKLNLDPILTFRNFGHPICSETIILPAVSFGKSTKIWYDLCRRDAGGNGLGASALGEGIAGAIPSPLFTAAESQLLLPRRRRSSCWC